jgi:hypothetical protein
VAALKTASAGERLPGGSSWFLALGNSRLLVDRRVRMDFDTLIACWRRSKGSRGDSQRVARMQPGDKMGSSVGHSVVVGDKMKIALSIWMERWLNDERD